MKMNMKRVSALVVPVLVLAAMLSGCAGRASNASKSNAANAPVKEEKIKVMASFYPLYDFAVKIGGDRAEVINMVPSGTEPHDWEPGVTEIRNLEEADLFIYNGAGMEHWVDTVLAGLENRKLISVEASKGVSLREGHSHEKEHPAEAGHGHAEEEGHDHGLWDPHVWLDPENAKTEMKNIRDAFIKADPDYKETYETNYVTYAARLDELDEEYRSSLSTLPDKDIVVSHEAFGYLCDAYGLNQVGVEGLSPDSEPDPARMAEVIDFVKAHNVKYIFFEELVSPKVAKAIAKETGAEVLVLNPLEGLSDEEMKAGADYFSVMKENLKQLRTALDGE